jgi:hypothetical protein
LLGFIFVELKVKSAREAWSIGTTELNAGLAIKKVPMLAC